MSAKGKTIVPVETLSEDTKQLMEVLNTQDDLACVVVGAAFLDTTLKTLLSERLLKCRTTEKLLDDGGALGTFSARAALAYSVGAVRERDYTDLCTVMEIRNQFAHKHLKLAFDDSKVREKCNRLKGWKVLLHGNQEDTTSVLTPEQLNAKARKQFTLSVILLANWLLIAALELRQHQAVQAAGA